MDRGDYEVTLDKLLPICKILSVHKGYIDVKPEHLQHILNGALHSSLHAQVTSQTPVAIIAVIGSEGGGKTLFTNFLLQYLRSGCDGSWWANMKSQNERGEPISPGFAWGTVSHPKLFLPERNQASTSGIYLWPEPVLMERSKNDPILVWVMHVDVVKGDNAMEDLTQLEKFLTLACSRLMEIEWNNTNKFRILEHSRDLLFSNLLSPDNAISAKEICDSIVYVIRSPNKSVSTTGMTDNDAKEKLLALVRESRKNSLDSRVIDHFQHVNIKVVKDSAVALHGDDGIFDYSAMKPLNRTIKEVVSTMMEESEIIPKRTSTGATLTLGEMYNYLLATAKKLSPPKETNGSGEIKIESENETRGDQCENFHRDVASKSEGTEMKLLETCIDDEEEKVQVTPFNQNDEKQEKYIQRQTAKMTASVVEHHLTSAQATATTSVANQLFEDTTSDISSLSLNEFSMTVISPSEHAEAILKTAECYEFQDDTEYGFTTVCRKTTVSRTILTLGIDTSTQREISTLQQIPNTEVGLTLEIPAAKEVEGSNEDKRELVEMDVEDNSIDIEESLGEPMDVESTEVEQASRQMELNLNVIVAANKAEKHEIKKAQEVVESQRVKIEQEQYQGPRRKEEEQGPIAEKEQHRKLAEEYCRQEDHRHQVEEDHRRQVEEEHHRLEEEYRRQEEEHRRQVEEEHRRQVEEYHRRQVEEEHHRLEEDYRRQEEEHRRQEEEHRRQEEEHRRQEEEHRRQEEEHRRQVEEGHRRQAEEKRLRQMMEDCLQDAVSETMGALQPSMKSWINSNLSPLTMKNILNIYISHMLPATLQNYQNNIDTTLQTEFRNRLNGHCQQKCQTSLQKVFNVISRFNEVLQQQFEYIGCFPNSPRFDDWAFKELDKLLKTQTDEFVEMTICAGKKLMDFYRNQNEVIRNTEKEIYKFIMSEIIREYNQQMKRYLVNAPYRFDQLKNIHATLVEKLLTVLTTVGRLANSNVEEMMTEEIQTIKDDLGKAFLIHRETNKVTLRNMRKMASKIISNANAGYTQKIEAVLERHPNGINEQSLILDNNVIKEKTLDNLEKEMKSNVRKDEPLEGHMVVVRFYMDEYWLAVEAENRKRLDKKEKEDQEKRERNKREARQQLEKEAEQQALKNGGSSRDTGSCTSSSKSSMTTEERLGDAKNGPHAATPLPPLIFHLQSSQIFIAVAIDGLPVMEANDRSEVGTTACVSVHHQTNQLIYGAEAVGQARFSEYQDYSIVQDSVWSIADILASGDLNWSKYYEINGTQERITLEFLLGFLFKNLKNTVEARRQGQFSTTLIAIPFWLSSPQRVQIRDAALMAGFLNVYLVNESSAAAYNFVLGDVRSRRSGKVMIVSENCDHFNAFVYSCNGNTRKIKMTVQGSGSTSNQDGGEMKKKNYILQKWENGVKKMKASYNTVVSHFKSGEQESKDMTILRDIQNVCEDMISLSRNGNADMHEVLTVYANPERWRDLVTPIVETLGQKPKDIEEASAVMRGLAALSQNPEEIGYLIRDMSAYDVLRYSEMSERCAVSSYTDFLPEKVQIKKNCPPLRHGENNINFDQNVMGVVHQIGNLHVVDLPQDHVLEPVMEITNEAIFRFNYAIINSGLDTKVKVDPAKVLWVTSNLQKGRRDHLKELLNQVVKPSSISKEESILAQRKTELTTKCDDMINRINSGDICIPSDFIKRQVIQLLVDAKAISQHPKPTLERIQRQWANVEKLSLKYDKPKEETKNGN